MGIKVLHICNSYQTNTLYQELFRRIQGLDISQYVIAPGFYKHGTEIIDNVRIYYFLREEHVLQRLFWGNKIDKIAKFTMKNLDVRSIDLIHAHTLFSDGAVAYELWRKYSIPYVVAVRNTDINFYFRYFMHYRQLGYQILKNASKIFLISESNKRTFHEILPARIKKQIEFKIELIPNGINDFWLSNRSSKIGCKYDHCSPVKLAYVGDFVKNKNILSVVKAVEILKNEGYNITFTAIGKKINECNGYSKKMFDLEVRCSCFKTEFRMDKIALKEYYKTVDIFVMPSFTETFGLVYIEALSQGLPVIYSQNQGIDQFYEEGHVGYHVNPFDVEDIAAKIILIVENYNKIVGNITNLKLNAFNWDAIANRYHNIYKVINE